MSKLVSIYIASIYIHAFTIFCILFCVVKPRFLKYPGLFLFYRKELPVDKFFYIALFIESFWFGSITFVIKIMNGLILS